MSDCIDIVILSNAPGEITTWVYPVVKRLCEEYTSDTARISIVLSPCTNASGQEAAIARSYSGVDRVIAAADFFPFLLWGKTPEPNWDWHKRGAVIFLGGDQIYPVVIGKRLGYATVIYAEWEARWLSLIDRFAVRNDLVAQAIPAKFQSKVTKVGDLMVDIFDRSSTSPHTDQLSHSHHSTSPQSELIVFMPGSKPMKLRQGVPLCLGIADFIRSKRPQVQFAIALAPTLSPPNLATYAQPNFAVNLVQGTTAELIEKANGYYLKTPQDTEIAIHTQFPAHNLLRSCQICVTTVGANTAELAALAVPMVVLLPTNQLDAMRGWDGLLGIITNLPVLGGAFAKLVNRFMLSNLKLLAWPNIWAGKEIVPEIVGNITSADIGKFLLNLLEQPEQLQLMRDRLAMVRGEPGAAAKIVNLVREAIAQKNT